MGDSQYALLKSFRGLFDGVRYLHRISNLGDRVASFLYEDLYALGKSKPFQVRVSSGERVVNAQNVTVGTKARRGDGTFGELVPGSQAVRFPGLHVARGPVATVEIGAETKILAKAND